MATKLFLRRSTDNGIVVAGTQYYDMLTTAGNGTPGLSVSTTASGTEIQWQDLLASGDLVVWVSGRVPAGGFTLTSTDISVWLSESNMSANIGGRYRVFKRTSGGVETELGGGPFDDGVECGTTLTEMTWVGNVTDTALAENDRVLLKVYATNVGTMGGSFSGTLSYDAADGASGDSFFNIAETVVFKSESVAEVIPYLITQPMTPPLARIF